MNATTIRTAQSFLMMNFLRDQADGWSGLSNGQSAQYRQDQQNHEHESQSTAGVVAPTTTMRPSRDRTQQHENQQNNENGSEHDGCLSRERVVEVNRGVARVVIAKGHATMATGSEWMINRECWRRSLARSMSSGVPWTITRYLSIFRRNS